MKALKLVERMPDVDVSAEVQSWNSRLQMASLAPNGVEKLRQLILDLAIRGKLVPQNLKDEPAINFLEHVKAKGEQAGISKGRKKKVVIEEFDEPFVLPVGWEWASLSSLANVIRGVTYSKSDASEVPLAGFSPLLRGNNIGKGLNFEKLVFVPKNLIADHQFIRAGDIVIAMSSGSADLVGKAAQANSDFEGGFGAFCGVIRPKIDLLSTYFGFFFQTPYYRTTVARQGKGIGINNLQKTQLELLAVPVPPFREQQRIASKVSELMDLCDKLEAQKEDAAAAHEVLVKTLLGTLTQSQTAVEFQDNWHRIAQHFNALFTTESSIEELKKTILQLAIMGKLVPQDPKSEPANKLLERISLEKDRLTTAGIFKKSKSGGQIVDHQLLHSLPSGWEWSTLSNCSKLVTDGEHLTPERTLDISQVPLVTAKNVRDGYLDFTNTDFVPRNVAEKCWRRCKPQKGDILVVSVGATTGRLSICNDEIDMVIVRSVTLIKPVVMDVDFLSLVLRSPLLQKMIWKGVKKNAQPCLYLSVSQALPIPVPPIEEQKRIAAKVDELINWCNTLKRSISKHSALHEHLATAIVQSATV